MNLEEGMYVRTPKGISKIISMYNEPNQYIVYTDKDVTFEYYLDEKGKWQADYVDKASHNILDLIEYMDLLILEKPFKVYGSNEEFMLFNPVRCDGFTDFEDGTHCIILDLIFIVDVKELKIKGVLTHEQFDKNCYMIGGN